MSLSAIHRTIVQLEKQMQAAVEAENFEEAARLRDRISEMRGEAEPGLVRKPPPDQIGMGSGMPVVARPKDWRPPRKPDPLTSRTKPRRGK